MAQETPCQTSGAEYDTYVHEREYSTSVGVDVQIPWLLGLAEEDADILLKNIHNAMELVLAPLFVGKDF